LKEELGLASIAGPIYYYLSLLLHCCCFLSAAECRRAGSDVSSWYRSAVENDSQSALEHALQNFCDGGNWRRTRKAHFRRWKNSSGSSWAT